MSLLGACSSGWVVYCGDIIVILEAFYFMDFLQGEYIVEVLWAVVRYHDIGGAAGGFPGCKREGQGFFCVVFVAGFIVSCSYFSS